MKINLKFWAKYSLMLGGALACSLLFWQFAFAQEDEVLDETVDEELGIARCISKGNWDFIAFLRSVTVSDGFYDAFIEPWNDVLYRNQCHANDVLGLLKQRDRVRSYIRDAFLTCDTEKLPLLKKGFYEASAEIFYVRNLVDGKLVGSLPFDLINTRENEKEIFKDSGELYKLMKAKYVEEKGFFKQKEFDLLFKRLEIKYVNRKESYVKCEKGSIEELGEKWQEFVETAGGITPAWEKAKNNVGGRLEKISEAVNEDFSEGETEKSFGDFLGGFFEVNVTNGAGEDVNFDSLYEEIVSGVSDLNVGDTAESILGALTAAEKLVDIDAVRSELEAKYTVYYKNLSDGTSRKFIQELDKLNKILAGTIGPIRRFEQGCVDEPNDRQCSQ